MKNLLLLTILIGTSQLGPSQTLEWVRMANDHQTHSGMDVALDRNGNLYVLASNTSYLYGGYCGSAIYKYNPDGSGGILWASDTSDLSGICTNGMLTDTNGNCYLYGSYSGASNTYCVLAKISSAGIELWKRLIRLDSLPYMQFALGCFDPFGNIGITASSQSSQYANPDKTFVLKFDTDGNVIWEKQKSGSKLNIGGIILSDHNGNFIVDAADLLNFPYVQLTKFSGSNGKIMWCDTLKIGSNGASVDRLLIDNHNNLFPVGQLSFGAAIDPKYLCKIDSNGNLLWQSGTDDDGEVYADYFVAATMDEEGNCYLTTQHLILIGDFNLQVVPEIEKFNSSDGSKMWSYIFDQNATGFNLNNVLTDIVYSNHKIYATGFYSADNSEKKFLTLCLDENGKLLWSDLYGDNHLPDRAFAITANDSLGVYVTGANSDSTNPSALTIKYGLTTGMPASHSVVSELAIFPAITNAAVNINIASEKNTMAKLAVTDAIGRIRQIIYTGEISAQPKSISYDCTPLPCGIYFVTLQTNNELTTKMFLKQ